MKDCFDNEIEVGDRLLYPASGVMYYGLVTELKEKTLVMDTRYDPRVNPLTKRFTKRYFARKHQPVRNPRLAVNLSKLPESFCLR